MARETFHELANRSALVPLFGNDVSGHAMAAAAKLVGRGARIDAVYVLRVPRHLSLDASLEREEQVARNVLETARLAARAERLKIRTSIVRTRNPGAAIVDEAIRLDTEVIYLATDHAPAKDRAVWATATYLLEKRPCRIVVETLGGGVRTESARRVPPHVPAAD
jgi:hypothetical protein